MRAALALAAFAVALAAAAPAAAQRVYSRVDADARTSVGELDLAEQAGEEPSGQTQTSALLTGVSLSLGIRSADIRVGLEAGVARGGLDLGEIETLYFGSSAGGGAGLTANFGIAAAVDRPLRERLVGVGRLGVGFALASAENDAGSARVDSFYMDVGGGVGLDLDTAVPLRLEAIAAARVHRVYRVDVSQLTEGRVTPDTPAVFVQPGLRLGVVALF